MTVQTVTNFKGMVHDGAGLRLIPRCVSMYVLNFSHK